MAEPVYIVPQGDGDPGPLLIPAFIPPGYLLFETFKFLNGLHLMFQMLVAAGELMLIYWIATFLITHLPKTLAAILVGTYMATTYGGFVWWLGTDQVWTGGVGAIAAVIGFYEAKKYREERERKYQR